MNEEFLKLLKERHSCRAFTPEVPTRENVLKAVEAASFAASSKNTQPWKLHLATGAVLEKVRADLLSAFDAGAKGSAEFRYYPETQPAEWMDRARACGMGIFAHKGIARDDKPARLAHDRENFRLFGAPAVAVLSLPKVSERGNYLDAGQFLASFMLALRATGYESVPMFSVANHPAAFRSHLPIPEDRAVVCAVAFGVEDAAAHVNAFRTGRESPESLLTWD